MIAEEGRPKLWCHTLVVAVTLIKVEWQDEEALHVAEEPWRGKKPSLTCPTKAYFS